MDNNYQRAHLFIEGRVQGVFFRANISDEAQARGLAGWVRNTADGRVEAVFEGPAEDVEDIISWCHHGPQGASVSKVDVEKEEPQGDSGGFNIRYD
ncbi:MAG: acylphosphatase [Chlamydiota bacterium]